MIRLPNLTFAALLDHVEAHLRRWARDRAELPPQAYAADAEGLATVLGFPLPEDAAGRKALAAILELEARERGAAMVALALPATAGQERPGSEAPGDEARREVLVLDGRALAAATGGAAQSTRLLAVERRSDGRIARLFHSSPVRPSPPEPASESGKCRHPGRGDLAVRACGPAQRRFVRRHRLRGRKPTRTRASPTPSPRASRPPPAGREGGSAPQGGLAPRRPASTASSARLRSDTAT
jgi:hypothetical protein